MSAVLQRPLGDASAFHAIFFEEADEHLSAVEGLLLALDPAAPDAEALNGIFRAVHSIKGSAGMLGFAEIVALTHVFENLLDILRKKERALTREDVDAMLRAGDCVKMQVAFRRGTRPAAPDASAAEAEIRGLLELGGEPAQRHYRVRLGPLAEAIDADALKTMLEGLAEMGSLGAPDIRNAAGGEIAFELTLAGGEADLRSVLSLVVAPEQIHLETTPIAPAKPAEDPAMEIFTTPQILRERRRSQGRRAADEVAGQGASDAASIRVSIEKIDRLVNLVGELVITEAMVAQEHGPLPDLARHTRNLQEAVMAVRMVPISAVFSRFPRLVRELSQRLGKEVEMRTSGEGTELDRGMIEKITDPLTHLVRNAVDHGMETPEAREAAGKPRSGTVTLSASQKGGSIVIEVRDDGRGLDRARILARAAERGVSLPQNAPDRDVWQLIFEAGFSTAEAVTEVSGRGVGMDVVRRNIQSLGGTVELASSPGAGTTVTVSVPLTLAIIEAMTVGVGGKTYVLPLASVIESRRIAAGELRGIGGFGTTLLVREDYIPVRRMRQDEKSGGGIAVIVEADGGRAALLVDELIGQQQVVVKSLEANFRRMPGFSGATIMGDGSVALILDVSHIVNQAVLQ